MKTIFPGLRLQPRILVIPALIALLGVTSAVGATRSAQQVNRQIERELLERPEFVQARQNLMVARAAYDAARREIQTRLWENGRFLRLHAEADRLQDQVDAIHHAHRYGIAPRQDVTALALRIKALRSEARQMEADALDAATRVVDARYDLESTGREVLRLYRQIPDRIRSDPRFRRAQR
jgi:hypothetical protein